MPDDLFDLLERRTFSSDSLVGGMLHDQAVEIKRLRALCREFGVDPDYDCTESAKDA